MDKKGYDISLDLGWNERYDHKVAIGIIKYARQRENWRVFGNEWLFRTNRPGEQSTDGIIARITDRDDLNRAMSYGVPVVDIANSYEGANLPAAANDDVLTGGMGAEHFLGKGFTNLAYIGIAEVSWSRRRLEGMRAALRRADETAEVRSYSVDVAWFRREHSLDGIALWLKSLPLPCGLMAANDFLGYRVTVAAAMAGLAIPDQLAVLGVDNEDVYCELANPRLSSIACDCERIGTEAAQLLARILNREETPPHVAVPPLGIHARESTAVVLGEDKIIRDVRNYIRANVGRGINVADVAECFPLSRRALEKRFKHSEGGTIHEAIQAARLEKARQLLADGKSANVAGFASGFSTLQHFYHAFKNRFGMTPMEYAAQSVKTPLAPY